VDIDRIDDTAEPYESLGNYQNRGLSSTRFDGNPNIHPIPARADMQERLENGLVVRVTGGDVWVVIGAETVACSLRGRFRLKEHALQIVAGDRVRIRRGAGGGGALEEVLPRRSWLSRYVARDLAERMIVSNVDRLFLVASMTDPPPHPAFLDRVLAAAEWGHAPVTIVINKTDLVAPGEIEALRAIYEGAGYEVVESCAIRGDGLDALERRLGRDVYAFVGESGVGKSSLLNRLDPGFLLEVREVGERTGRGRHTTTFSQLFPFREGYLADTPGMQTFHFPGDDEHAVAGCFAEMARIAAPCRFSTCTHTHEPGCAVKAAVEAGAVYPSRYQSYLDIVAEVRERAKRRTW
jgi:ribosome biogenesis GTPase / thiamine phosphate phosphatase